MNQEVIETKLVGIRKTRSISVKASDAESVTVSLTVSLEHLTVGDIIDHGLRQIVTDWSNTHRNKPSAKIREGAKGVHFASPLRSPVRGLEDMSKDELLALITKAQAVASSK
jgi:hypothetical protein